MRLLEPASEDEMAATFLRAELDSGRYGAKLRELLARDGRGERVLLRPDLGSPDECRYRLALLDEHRAYERREGLFFGWPEHVEWHRAALTPDEVLGIRYINWDWWLEASGGSRRPSDAARRIHAGEIPGVTVAEHETFADAAAQPELIAATTEALEPLVLVEGHARLTAYALFPERLPDELEILLGVSPAMTSWCQF
jgi:hypothetical protein